MTTERDSRTRLVLSWLREDAHENAERVLLRALDEVDTTEQRRLLWPARRFAEMSSYTRLLAAAAAVLVVVVVGASLTRSAPVGAQASPTPSPTTSPAATTTSSAAAPSTAALLPGEFTACVPGNNESKHGTDEQASVSDFGGATLTRKRGYTWKGTITATDDRFTGTHYYSWDSNEYTLASGQHAGTWAEGHVIANDGGTWEGSAYGVNVPDTSPESAPVFLTGHGGYDGLSAVLMNIDGSCFYNFRGLVMETLTPPVPYTGG